MAEGIRGYDPVTLEYRELRCQDQGDNTGILVVVTSSGGRGDFHAVPVPSGNGTELNNGYLSTDLGVLFYLQPGDSVTIGFAPANQGQLGSAIVTSAFTNPSSATSEKVVNIGLQKGQDLYVTTITGAPTFRRF